MRGRTVTQTWCHDPALYAPAKYRRACRYEAFIPQGIADFQESLSIHAVGAVADAASAMQELNMSAQRWKSSAPLARLLLRSESIASSRIEGLQVDARDVARAEVKAGAGKAIGPTVAEVLANIDAMEVAIAESTQAQEFTVEHITQIHRALLCNTSESSIAGQIRAEQNWIGGNAYNPCGAAYVPPPPGEVMALLRDLCDAMNADYLPPIMQAALVHAQFETIHPFADGNGRTGRALIHVVLRRRGLASRYVPSISVVLAANKTTYINGLEGFRQGPVDDWVTLFATAVVRGCELARNYVAAAHHLQQQWREKLNAHAAIRSDSVAWTLIDEVLPGYPVITLAVAAAVTGRTKAVVNTAINQLAAAGILIPLSPGTRNRLWEPVGLLDAIAEVESSGGGQRG